MKISAFAAALAASAAVASMAMPAAAQTAAQPKFYGTLGYSFIDGGNDVNLGAITGRVGARLHRYFGVEGEAGIGVTADHTTQFGVDVKTTLKSQFAGYAVAFVPVLPKFELLARGGYGTSRVRAATRTASVSDSDSSWNYGGGGQYLFTANDAVRAEYTRYDFGNGRKDADAFTFSYVRQF